MSAASPEPGRALAALCLCADDFGLSEGVNAAVLDLAEHGKLSATGCMVMRPSWLAGAPRLRQFNPELLQAGLHLDLTRSSAPGQIDHRPTRLIALAYLGLLNPARLRATISEQFSRFEDAMGRAPAFVDGHQHVHQLPTVRRLLLDEIVRRYGSAPPWVRVTAPVSESLLPRRKEDVIFALGGRALRRQAKQRGVPSNQRLLGVYNFEGGPEVYRALMKNWLDSVRAGDVLMCHPSLSELANDPIAQARKDEYAVLMQTDFSRFGIVAPG